MQKNDDKRFAGKGSRLPRRAGATLGLIAALAPAVAAAWGDGSTDRGGSEPGCGNGSCPFLCAWNGDRFVFDNDVLHGRPTSLWPSVAEGKRAYEGGAFSGDTLKLSTKFPAAGHLRFQLREIEPEQSFIDAVSLERVRHPRGTSLYVGGDLGTVHVVSDQAITERAGIEEQQVSTVNGETVAWLSDPARRQDGTTRKADDSPVFLPLATGEYIVLDARRSTPDSSADTFLYLESYYRDWTPGTIYSGTKTYAHRSPVRTASRGRLMAAAAFASILGTVALSGASHLEHPKNASSMLVPTAHADHSEGRKSLVIRYWNGTTWAHIETVTPRVIRPSATLVRIPVEAFDASGRVRLAIEATRRHHVTSCFLFCHERNAADIERKTFAPKQAMHRRDSRDYAATLARRDRTYMRLIPADVVDLAFELPPLPRGEARNVTLLFRSHGFYTPAPETVQREAGDWVAKLDPGSYAVLRTLYALDADRTGSA